MVNLVDQKGYEKPVKDAYERNVSEVRFFTLSMSRANLIVGRQMCRGSSTNISISITSASICDGTA